MDRDVCKYDITGLDKGFLYFNYLTCLNFSMQHNHYNSLIECVLMNDSDIAWDNVELEIEGEMFISSKVSIDIVPANSHIDVNNLSIDVNPNELIQLTESIDAKFSVIIKLDDDILFKKDFPIQLMTYEQWTGISILPELLASFVTPNYPLITRITVRASKYLEQWTGSGSLDEYQSQDPNRVRAQVSSIFESLRNESIVYAAPPATFEAYGQRIRTVDKVLTEKLGTCVDLSVLFASCLESIGINPILVLTKGHCFVGAWLVNDSYNRVVGDDGTFLSKSASDGLNEIILVETTCITSSSPVTFEDAVSMAKNHLFDESKFDCFIDVYRARLNGIRPIPLRIKHDGEWIIENEGVEHENATKSIKQYDRYDLSNYDNSDIKLTKFMLWERKLLDFSLRNNLLNMRLGKKIIPLVSFSVDRLEDFLQDGKTFQILPFPLGEKAKPEPSGVYISEKYFKLEDFIKKELANNRLFSFQEESDLNNSLKYVYRTSRTSMEENGANNLYMVLGVLKWHETDRSQQARLAPVLLLPIEIVRGKGVTGYIIRTRDEEIVLNVTLIELLKQHSVDLSVLSELPKDDYGVDVKKIFAIIRNKIRDKKGWEVLDEAIIGLFSFNKFVMWNDIHSNSEKMLENEVISSIVNGQLKLSSIIPDTDARDIDKKHKPEDYTLPVDVDSSQLEAIVDSGNGNSFILYGPPGTGKSQTITNMIANALYQGRRVLFVAEKMAALSVVQARLKKIGLAPFCLELHSNKATKTHFLEQMDEAINITHKQTQKEYRIKSDELFKERQTLIQYIDALHKVQKIGISLFDSITYYLSLDNEEMDVSTFTPVSKNNIDDLEERINKLDTIFRVSGNPSLSPLNNLEINDGSYESEQILTNSLLSCLEKLKEWKDIKDRYTEMWGFPVQETSQGLLFAGKLQEFLNGLIFFSKELFLLSLDGLKLQNLKEVVEAGKERDEKKKELVKSYTSAVLQLDAVELKKEWSEINGKWFIPRYFAKKSYLKKKSVYKLDFSESDLLNIIQVIDACNKYDEIIKPAYDELSQLFGILAYYGKEQWDIMMDIIEKVPIVIELANELSEFEAITVEESVHKMADAINGNWTSFVYKSKESTRQLVDLGKQIISSMDKIHSVAMIKFDNKDWCNGVLPTIERLYENNNKFKDWYQWCREKRKLENEGLSCVVNFILEKKSTGEAASKAFAKGVYHKLSVDIINNDEQLRFFNGIIFKETIEKYRTLTAKFQNLSKEELYCKLAANIPSMTMAAHDSSEVGILKKNIRNNGRGTSIRKIIDQIPTLLPKLCPCMLMSPISVAQYVDLNNEKFDLVIFDEASQIPTSESVGAIARGKALVVVGDPKQMPPTSFFASSQVDEDEVDIDDQESILEDCMSLSMPSKYLTWHYRSKHESLISFSNSQYYDGKLITFPSIDDQISKVTLRQINGVYDKGKTRSNLAEAQAIVEEVKERLSNPKLSHLSIGIVSFSKVQQNLIDDLLCDELAKYPKLESLAFDGNEPIFIKNLENVQGDERDVILFSVGYGPDKYGKVSMNFGPLNNNGGERRLNVAVSRARYEMVVFSTLRAEQIDLKRTHAAGVEGLKKFLEFAEKGSAPVILNNVNDNIPSCIVQQIAASLKEKGYSVKMNVGRSKFKVDIAIVNPEKPTEYLLGILCDGNNYYQTKTVRDREIVQPTILKLLHWNCMHIWTLDWLERPQEVINGILQRLEDIIRGRIQVSEINETQINQQKIASDVNVYLEPIIDNVNDLCQDYVFASINQSEKKYLEIMDLKLHESDTIREQLQMLIHIEQPITNGLLYKRIVKIWGLARVSTRVQAVVDSILKNVVSYKSENGNNGCVYWKDQDSFERYTQYRLNSGRDIQDVPYVEIENAMRYTLNQQIAMGKDDLKRLTAQQLGYTRKGNNIDNATEAVLQRLIGKNFASLQDDKVCKV